MRHEPHMRSKLLRDVRVLFTKRTTGEHYVSHYPPFIVYDTSYFSRRPSEVNGHSEVYPCKIYGRRGSHLYIQPVWGIIFPIT